MLVFLSVNILCWSRLTSYGYNWRNVNFSALLSLKRLHYRRENWRMYVSVLFVVVSLSPFLLTYWYQVLMFRIIFSFTEISRNYCLMSVPFFFFFLFWVWVLWLCPEYFMFIKVISIRQKIYHPLSVHWNVAFL